MTLCGWRWWWWMRWRKDEIRPHTFKIWDDGLKINEWHLPHDHFWNWVRSCWRIIFASRWFSSILSTFSSILCWFSSILSTFSSIFCWFSSTLSTFSSILSSILCWFSSSSSSTSNPPYSLSYPSMKVAIDGWLCIFAKSLAVFPYKSSNHQHIIHPSPYHIINHKGINSTLITQIFNHLFMSINSCLL